MKKWLIWTCLVPLAAAAQGGPARVEVAPAIVDEGATTQWVTGTVISRSDARVAAEVPGRVTQVAEVGDYVSAGDALVAVDTESLRLQLEDNAATQARLRAQLAYQESRLARFRKLAEDNNAARNEIDEAEMSANVLRQDIRAAQVQAQQLERRLQQSTVRAPFSGHVVERLVQIGEYVNTGMPVIRLVDTDHREVRAQAPLAVARYLRPDMQVRVEGESGSLDNRVRVVVPVGDETSRMVEVRIELEGAPWLVGSSVRVALPVTAPRRLTAVPRDALVLRGGKTYVFRVNSDLTAERIEVRPGAGLGDFVEIEGDVKPGDSLVVRGAERLAPGQTVVVNSRSG